MDKCPKCKKSAGWIWHWSKSMTSGDGYSECKNCKEKFK